MDWNEIRLVVEIARRGSFSGAAEALGVSKPTISRRLEYIERRAGARLFSRTPHGAVITDAGKMLVTRARSVDDAVIEYQRVLETLGKSERPMVTARMTDGVATFLMMPAMAGHELGPLGIAAVRSGIRLPAIRLLRPDAPERADLSLIWTQRGEVPSSRVARSSDRIAKLAEIRFVPFVSGDYRRRVEGRKFDDLRGHRLVSMHAYKWFSADGWAQWHGIVEQSQEDTIEVDSSSSLAFLTGGGAGVGLLPTYSPLCMDKLVPVEVTVPMMVGTLWLCCSEDSKRDPAVNECFAAMRKLFRSAEWMNRPH